MQYLQTKTKKLGIFEAAEKVVENDSQKIVN